MSTSFVTVRIVPATESDIPLILSFIRRLAGVMPVDGWATYRLTGESLRRLASGT